MDEDIGAEPNELARAVAQTSRKWIYTAYSADNECNDLPQFGAFDKQSEIRLDRAISDLQTKVQSQKRVLDNVCYPISLTYRSYEKKFKSTNLKYKRQYKI
jgi:hypothetical protein